MNVDRGYETRQGISIKLIEWAMGVAIFAKRRAKVQKCPCRLQAL